MFKNYNTNQLVLPLDLTICLPKDDFSFLIQKFVESIPNSAFEDYFQAYGRPQYHPRMMLSILLCAYVQGITSGRKIENALMDSIRMRWLAQGECPNFRTINRFRVHPFMEKLLEISFIQFREALLQSGLITGESLFIDGTKMEADANKFSFVWKKTIDRYANALDEKALGMYRELVKEEILPSLLEELKEELSLEEIEEIRARLLRERSVLEKEIAETKEVEKRKDLRKKKSVFHKASQSFQDFSERKAKYLKAKATFQQRNSYSKTDTDATFLRMKDDYMKNGQLKPGYNIQVATENQFVLAHQAFPNPTDTRTLIPFLEKIQANFSLPAYIVADAGYGSEENYQYLIDKAKCVPLITYNMYHKEQTRKYKTNIFRRENWPYNEQEDTFVCPNKKTVRFRNDSKRKDKVGFIRDFKVYECEDCTACPLRSKCTKAMKGKNRTIQLNPSWEYFKAHVRELLKEEKTGRLYRQRKIDVEPVFGDIKKNANFTRFHVRGTQKISNEMGLCFLAHNFRKLHARWMRYRGKTIIDAQIGG
jgi:transposase